MTEKKNASVTIIIYTCPYCGVEMPDAAIYRDYHECPGWPSVVAREEES